MRPKLNKLVDELTRPLSVFEEGESAVFDKWMPQFSAAIGLTKSLLYNLQPEPHGYSLPFHAVHRPAGTVDFVTPYKRFLATSGPQWGFFNPMRPEPIQRNRVVTFEPHIELAMKLQAGAARDPTVRRASSPEAIRAVERTSNFFVSIGLAHDWQMRAVICDGDTLLAWLGGYTPEVPTPEYRSLFQRLVPAVARRLKTEQLLGTAPQLRLLLSKALDEVPGPAFIIAPGMRIEFANQHGAVLLDRSPTMTRAELAEVLQFGGGRGYRLSTVRVGNMEYRLLIGPRPSPLHERCALAVNAWELTPRQAEVLERLIVGDANKAIAAKLNCTTHTVELHVTAIFQKASVESRAALSAKFWMSL